MQKITPCLWFDDQAEEAVAFYTAIFKHSKSLEIARYTESGHEFHGKRADSIMTIIFELNGQTFTALNGGPVFTFNEAVSFQVSCENQQEVDENWQKLSEGGDERAQQCGWLKDKYGVSWQIVPAMLPPLLTHCGQETAQRVMNALLNMKKIDIAALQRAAGDTGNKYT